MFIPQRITIFALCFFQTNFLTLPFKFKLLPKMTAAAEMPSDDDGQKFIFDVGLVSECLFEVIEEQEKSKDVGKVLGNAITPKDVETLKKSEYLNDSIINAYLQMVAKEKPGEVCFLSRV